MEKGTIRVEGAFNVRFYDAGTLRPTPVPRANEHLHQTWMPRLMRHHGDLMENLASSSILEAVLNRTETSQVTPWFTEYTHEVSRKYPTSKSHAMGSVCMNALCHVKSRSLHSTLVAVHPDDSIPKP